jgi:carbon-monoxide dehydrogenase catalytic subunit
MATGTKPILGSEMVVNVDTQELAQQLVDDLNAKRKALGWS